MKRIVYLLFPGALMLGACAGTATTPVPAPTPTTVPSPTPIQEETAMPQVLFELTNESDPLKDPYGIAISSQGRIHVSEAGNSRVLVFED